MPTPPASQSVAAAFGGSPSLSGISPQAAGVDDRENSDLTGWYVYEHQTLAQVRSTASSLSLRVVDLYVETTAVPNLFTTIYVSNAGSYAKTWDPLADLQVDVDPTTLYNYAVTNNLRITVLKAFNDPAPTGSVRFYAVMIANTGVDYKNWWFYQGQSISSLSAGSEQRTIR